MAQLAAESFFSQTYPAKELVILDDADCLSFPDGVSHPLVRYHRTKGDIQYRIPEKRNKVNALASGDLIWHLDSDDYSAPERMAQQVERMELTGLAMTGYCTILFHWEQAGKAYEYRSKPHYACGSSLCYLKSWWQSNKFPENKTTGSDNALVVAARQSSQLDSIPGGNMLVARIHDGNTSKKHNLGPQYVPIPLSDLPAAYLALSSKALA